MRAFAAWAALVIALMPVGTHAQGLFSFAVIGDTPYFGFEEVQLAATLRALAREPVDFVIHVGDIKGGGTPCSDDFLAQRRALLDASPLPLVLAPGDNEWSDCHRMRAGGYDPVERLQRLRQLFFSGDESLGRRRLRMERQAGRAENARWLHDSVVFVTLNVPGTRNNARMPRERAARMADNLAWLDEAVRIAAGPGVRAIVVAAHAEPGFGPLGDDAYASFRSALATRATALGKPMLLVHGDDHVHAFDRPLADKRTGRRIEHFLRLSPYGSPAAEPVIVTVNPALPQLFEARSGLPP